MTRVAVVDLGTNSTRLLVAEVVGGRVSELARRLTITKLGERVDETRRLREDAIARVLECFVAYSDKWIAQFKKAHVSTPQRKIADWMADDTDLLEQAENAVARASGLEPGELLIDFPTRPNMLAVDLPLRLRDGRVERLTSEGRAGHLGLPRIADELYRSAQRLRVFVARPASIDESSILELVALPGRSVRERVAAGAGR